MGIGSDMHHPYKNMNRVKANNTMVWMNFYIDLRSPHFHTKCWHTKRWIYFLLEKTDSTGYWICFEFDAFQGE